MLEQTYYVAGIVAAFAVVGSLVYLSMQVRQSNALSRAQTRQSMMELTQDQLMVMVDHPDLYTCFTKEQPTELENIKLNCWLLAAMRAREYEWFAHKDGTIDSAMFAAYSGVIPILLGSERSRKWWSLRPPREFDPEFASYVDRMLSEKSFVDWDSFIKI